MKSGTVSFDLAKGCMLLLAFSLIFNLFTASKSLAETETVTVDGVAGLKENQTLSRDNAINDAQRKAVEQAVGVMLSSETLVENSALVRDSIYSKSQGYIKQYKIVKEGPDGDIYVVTIMAIIGVTDLKNDLGALGLLHVRVGKPRTLFMVAQQQIGRDAPQYLPAGEIGAAETAMKEEFMNKEFNVVDRASLSSKHPNPDILNGQASINTKIWNSNGTWSQTTALASSPTSVVATGSGTWSINPGGQLIYTTTAASYSTTLNTPETITLVSQTSTDMSVSAASGTTVFTYLNTTPTGNVSATW